MISAAFLTPNQIAAWCVIAVVGAVVAWHAWIAPRIKAHRAGREQWARDYEAALRDAHARDIEQRRIRAEAELEALYARPVYDQGTEAK